MASLSLRHIDKVYAGGVKAVSDFNLEIDDKEFIVFVGPSGCGKSTTLRMIAGLEEISLGELYIDGRLVNDVEPKDRDIAMVFQNYALYPHMTVYDNMAFGLKLRRVPADEIKRKVEEAADILGIRQLLTRKPKALSGGQRQRVALGRAIVREPKVFLLDEPLSNLDAKLRVQMRTEITKLHNKLATTFIYVTHDQTEAMTMGTRIVVMKDGLVQQVDTPQSLYDNPRNLFVASFIGTPQMNFIKAVLSKEGSNLVVKFGENVVKISESKSKRLMDESYIGREVIFGVRPEDIHDEEVFIKSSPETAINAHVDVIEKLGNETILYMKVDGKEEYCIARVDARSTAKSGDAIRLAIDAKHVHLFDLETEQSIMGVPAYNYLNADLKAAQGGAVAECAAHKFFVSETILSALIDRSVIGSKIKLGISPDAFSENPDEYQDKFTGTIEFTEKYSRYIAAYVKSDDKKGYTVVKLPLETTLEVGATHTFSVNPEKYIIANPDTLSSLLASHVLVSNNVPASVSVSNGISNVRFGKNSVNVAGDLGVNGPCMINIDASKLSAAKEVAASNPKAVIKGVVMDVDTLNNETILYLQVDGFAPYFVARVNDAYGVKTGDKIKITVGNDAITALR